MTSPDSAESLDAKAIEELERLGNALRTQDNRITHCPVFMVQEKRRITGIDEKWDPEICWIQDDYTLTRESPGEDPSFGELEAEYKAKGEEPEDWTRTGYVEQWHNVQPFLTEEGAVAYLRVNGHNLKETRIYVESGYRNAEWEFVRGLLGNEALLRLARLGMKAGAFLRAHGDSIVQGLVVAEDSADLVDEEADEARAERAELETLIAFVNGGKNP